MNDHASKPVKQMKQFRFCHWASKTFKRLAFAFALTWAGANCFGQAPDVRFIPVAPDVLSSSFVRCIFKDKNGFMWFGTGNGLIRYDGTNVYRYEHIHGGKHVITDNRINAIIEDNRGELWIGTARGLVAYDPEHDHFINVDSISENRNHLNSLYISALVSDEDGKIWIGTHGNGLNVYDPKQRYFTYITENRGGNSPETGNYITSLHFKNDTIWAGTKGGLRLFSAPEVRKLRVPDIDQVVTSREITQVKGYGNITVLTTLDGEIIRLRHEGKTFHVERLRQRSSPSNQTQGTLLTLSIDKQGNVWTAGENTPLTFVSSSTGEIVQYKAGDVTKGKLPTNSIRYVFVDELGMTWIGTYNRGAYVIDNRAKKFESFDFPLPPAQGAAAISIKAIAEDPSGNIWLACDGVGIYELDARTRQLKFPEEVNRALATRHVSALRFDHENNLWVGTWGAGIYCVNTKTRATKHFAIEAKGFGDNKVSFLYEDSRNNIWAGSLGSGLFLFDKKSSQFVGLNEAVKPDYIKRSAYVMTMLEDKQGILWVATLFGLYKLRYNEGYDFDVTLYLKNNEPNNIGSYEIQTLFTNGTDKLYIGTGDNGLTSLDKDGVFRYLQKRHGLASNTVKAVLTDDLGNFWIGGNAGLVKFTPSSDAFRQYKKEDGLPSNEFQANACLRAADGRFYFGTDNGLVAFHPDSIADNPVEPIVYLKDLKLNNQSVQVGVEDSPLQKNIRLTSRLELPYEQRSFVLEFGAIHFGQSSRNEFCHKLEGFDEHWICNGANATATYTNLDPGRYMFLVNASNSDGVKSDPPLRLEIIIHQALWKTWWAFLSYLVAFFALIYFLLKVRIERIKFKNQLEFERLARQQEHLLTESKTQFFTDISHELRTPLTLITMPLESLGTMDELPTPVKDRIRTIRTSADKMMRLVNELLDFSKLQNAQLKLQVKSGDLIKYINEIVIPFNEAAIKRNIHFGVHSMVRSLEGWFDYDKVDKIIFNLLSNAFKFTADNGQINVIINLKVSNVGVREMRFMELLIVDNGIGIDEEELPFIFDKFYQAKAATKVANPGTGIGLSLTKGLVELLGGTIQVERTPEQETKFLVLLPIDRYAFRDEDVCQAGGVVLYDRQNQELTAETSGTSSLHSEDSDKPHILVVEDNEELRKYISLELGHQFVVIEASDGMDGLSLAFEKMPDLIISDILMPKKSGIEICTVLKSDLKTSHIPLILLTAKTTVDDQVNGIMSGADVYITKPFSIRFLLAQVAQLIDSRKKLYARFSQDVYLIPAKMATNEIDQAFLQKAIDYIIEHMQDSQLGVDSIAALFNLSRMQVYRKVKALTGKSIVDFIRMVRLKQALKLMETQKYTLSEVAFQTGFNSASYFTRSFKDYFGKAPSEYLEDKRIV